MALRGIRQRRRNLPSRRYRPRLPDYPEGFEHQSFVEADAHPLLCLEVINEPFLATIAVVAEDQSLDRKLDLVRGP